MSETLGNPGGEKIVNKPEHAPQTAPMELGVSNMNLIDAGTLYVAQWPLEDMVGNMVERAGYNGGFEWFPVQKIRAARQLNDHTASYSTVAEIKSLHQSFRQGKTLREGLDRMDPPNPVMVTVAHFLLPERIASLDDLDRIQDYVGHGIPVVLYPTEKPEEESGTQRAYGEKLYQPTAEVLKYWDVKDLPEMIKRGQDLGYTGIALDLFHVRERLQGLDLGTWDEIWPQVAPHTKEVHLSAGRIEGFDKSIPTMEELQDLMAGTRSSELYRMLVDIKESGWRGRIVTEIPAKALRMLRKKGIFSYSPQMLIEDNQRIVDRVKDLMFA